MDFTTQASSYVTSAQQTDAAAIVRSPDYLYIRGVGSIVFAVLGVIFNATALGLLLRLANIKNTQIVLVINMCVMSLLYSLFLLPIFAYIQLTREALPEIPCALYAYFTWGQTGLVLGSLVLITLHRYFLIIFPNSRYLSMGRWRKTLVIIAIDIVVVYAILLAPFLGISGKYGYDAHLLNCTVVREESRIFSIFVIMTGFGIPLAVKFLAYSHIFAVVYRQRKRIQNAQQNSTRQKSEMRLTVICCLLVLVFVVSFVPFGIMSAVPALERMDYIHGFATILQNVHMLVNPVLYLYGDGQMRTKIAAMFSRDKAKKPRIVSISVDPVQEN